MSTQATVPLEPGRVIGGAPLGLFYRIDVDFVSSRRMDTRIWLFLPENRISRIYPVGGTGLFDPSRCNPDTCGSYQIGAGRLSVRWDGGRVDHWTFDADAQGISVDGSVHRPARAMTAASLVGRWSNAGYGGSNIYTFAADGRCSFGTSSNALRGTYRVEELTLILEFSDGDVRRRTLFAVSTADPAKMISVDAEVYARS